jgi:hypothetical protein
MPSGVASRRLTLNICGLFRCADPVSKRCKIGSTETNESRGGEFNEQPRDVSIAARQRSIRTGTPFLPRLNAASDLAQAQRTSARPIGEMFCHG